MTNGPLDKPEPSSEPATLILSKEQQSRDVSRPEGEPSSSSSPSVPPASFSSDEGPTLSSPSVSSESKFATIASLEIRIASLESRLAQSEREVSEVYGAVEHLVTSSERMERALRQQRFGRFLVWGTLIAILGILWLSMQSRLGSLLPH